MRGVPAELNEALAAGAIDAAPCSSIEYARHAADYRILPRHAIGAVGAVRSILLESRGPLDRLDGATVAVPTASATSVVLLRVLLEQRLGVRPRYEWYEQARGGDPLADGAAAALRIGDVALGRRAPADRLVTDLGAAWTDWTGLPFAFAVWQVRRELEPGRVRRLIALLDESRRWFARHREELASRHAPRFGLAPHQLLSYWASLRFDFDEAMQRGLLHFFRCAAELGEAAAVATLDIVRPEEE